MAQPSDDDGRYQSAMVTALRDVTEKLGQIRAEVKEDTAQLLRGVREDMFRTTMAIHARLLSYEDELVRDRTQRDTRQQHLDGRLTRIEHNQRLLVRVSVVAALIGLGIVVGWLVL